MPNCPPLYVTPPAPAAARYGLIDSAIPLDVSDNHVRCGIQWEPLRCEAALPYETPCPDPPTVKTFTRGGTAIEVDPFTVYAAEPCPLVSMTDPAKRARLAAELQLGEARAVESAFATGIIGAQILSQGLQNAAASDDAVILAGGQCLSPCGAMAALESALGQCYGGEGFIHGNRGALPALFGDGYVARDGTRLRTLGGAVVVSGGGYPGNAPDGSAPSAGCTWVYATGSVYMWRGPIEYTAGDPSQYVNRENNDAVLIAERTYVVTFDCCLFAVQMDVSCC